MTDIAKIFENPEDALKENEKLENLETLEDSGAENSDFSIDKTMYYIALSLMSAELHTRSLVDSGQITEKELYKFSKKINTLRKNYKDLFSKLKDTDVSYAW